MNRTKSTQSVLHDASPRNARATLLILTCLFTVVAGFFAGGRTSPKVDATMGISLAGPEFGTKRAEFSNGNPGKPDVDYTYNSPQTVSYFAEQGITLFRLPVRWERLQPQLGGELNPQEVQRVRTFLGWVRSQRGRIILDLHNYGRYRLAMTSGGIVESIIDQRIAGKVLVSRRDFADLWRRIAVEFQQDPAIYAYGLMNEPHNMGASDWPAISQAAVDAIRATGDESLLLVAGGSWSSAERWESVNGPAPWIRDPVQQIAYEAHCYFDHDASGSYQMTFDAELAKDPALHERGRRRVAPFINWCARNHVPGVIGEFAVPRDARWQAVLAPFLADLRVAKIDAVWWAAGDWWGDYPMSLQPTADYRISASQLSWILDPQLRD